MSRAQEAAWNQQRQAGVASDEAALAQERKALGNVNRDANKAAAVAEKGIVEQRAEAEQNYRQNASAQDSFMNNEFNRPYIPYGYYGPSSVHYHYHR